MQLKPKVLVDISRVRKNGPYADVKQRVNLFLAPEKKIKFFNLSTKAPIAIIVALVALYFNSALAPTLDIKAQTAPRAESRTALQAELAELEAQIAEYERTVSGYRRQGATLQEEINRLNARINRVNLQIRAITLNLSQLNEEISDTTLKINATESEIEQKKISIANVIRDLERQKDHNLVEILLANPSLSDFFGNVNNILLVQNALSEILSEMQVLREEYINQKEQLSIQKADAESLRAHQEAQRREVEELRRSRRQILTVTRGREAEYQRMLVATRQTAAQIRARLYRMMDGGAMTFAQAYEHAMVAERATGVRAAILLAILAQESALGRNVGQCHYRTAMHPRRDIPVFYRIIAELNMEDELAAGSIKVSCPIPRDGAFGGAMGPAQFIPSTWIGYRERVSAITGMSPANPWNNRDAFIAAALLFRDNFNSTACRNYGSANRHILPENMLRERCAAAMYYAGGRWFRFRFSYGDSVLNRARGFADDIATIRGGQATR